MIAEDTLEFLDLMKNFETYSLVLHMINFVNTFCVLENMYTATVGIVFSSGQYGLSW